jgi:hypothetical protein
VAAPPAHTSRLRHRLKPPIHLTARRAARWNECRWHHKSHAEDRLQVKWKNRGFSEFVKGLDENDRQRRGTRRWGVLYEYSPKICRQMRCVHVR